MGTIYLLRDVRFKEQNAHVYKLGKSIHTDGRRFQAYAKGSEIIISIFVIDPHASERELLDVFRSKFTSRLDVGSETFEGSRRAMIDEILKHIPIDGAQDLVPVLELAPNLVLARKEDPEIMAVYSQIIMGFSNVVSVIGRSASLYDAYRMFNINIPNSYLGNETVDINSFSKYINKQISTKANRSAMRADDYSAYVSTLSKFSELYPLVQKYSTLAGAKMVKIKMSPVVRPTREEYYANIKLCKAFDPYSSIHYGC